MNKTISGFDSLDKKLAALGNAKSVQKVIRQAVGFAMTPMVKQAQKDIPESGDSYQLKDGRIVAPGFARRSIKKITQKGSQGDDFIARGLVGVRPSAWFATLYDGGFQRQGGSSEPGNNWLTDAGKDNVNIAISRFQQKLAKAIIKESKRNA